MRKIISIAAVTLASLAIAAATPAIAKGPGWKANASVPPGFSHGRKLGWGTATVPPGWTHGHKTGWRGASVPPGWSRPAR